VNQLSEADQYLLQGIRRGEEDAWGELVRRYEGRLRSFAAAQLTDRAEAEDLVQDTFLRFLRGLSGYRGQSSLETYLYSILRHRLIDRHRAAARRPLAGGSKSEALPQFAARGPTPSGYARREEAYEGIFQALSEALHRLLDDMRRSERLAEIKLTELLFYAQRPNKEAAALTGMDNQRVAMLKHRWLKQLADDVHQASGRADSLSDLDPDHSERFVSVLTEVWEQSRPSCPKYTTLGRYLLGTLEPAWEAYVQFHLDTIACRFCKASYDDLCRKTASPTDERPAAQLFESTVGFFRASLDANR
jgi:RNA polymerase sigma factor (sigma-70 family)